MLMVSYCDQSLSVVRALSTFCFKRLLLQNGSTDFEIILEGSLGDPLTNCSNLSAPLNKMAARAENRKTFKLLLLNQKVDFEIAARAINRNKLLTTSSATLVDRF